MPGRKKKLEAKKKAGDSTVRFRLAHPVDGGATASSSRSTHSTPSQHMRRYRARYLQLLMDGLNWLTMKRTRGAQASMSKSSMGSAAQSPSNTTLTKGKRAASKQKSRSLTSKRGRKPSKASGGRGPGRGRRAGARSKTGRRGRPAASTRRGRQPARRQQGTRGSQRRTGAAPNKGRPAVRRPPAPRGIKQRLRGYKRAVNKAY